MDYDNYISSLESDVRKATPKVVPKAEGSVRALDETTASREGVTDQEVDDLFGRHRNTPCYGLIRREKPIHRLILWLTLQGRKPKEISTLVGLKPHAIYTLQAQVWFRDAFCRLSAEMGKDSVQTLLEGEVVPTIQKLVALRDGADSDNVKLAAANAILDRFLGKPTVKVESKSSGTIDHVVHDAAKLQKDYSDIQRQLAARGLGTPSVGGN